MKRSSFLWIAAAGATVVWHARSLWPRAWTAPSSVGALGRDQTPGRCLSARRTSRWSGYTLAEIA